MLTLNLVMDQADSRALAQPVRVARPWATWVGLGLLLIAWSVMVGTFWAPAITHPDANGYWAQGTLMTHTGHSTYTLQSHAQYVGMHWLLTEKGDFISRYPPGFPLVVGLVYESLGWQASTLINPILGLFTLLGVYALGARLASPALGLFATALVALNPGFTSHALTDIAHMPVAFLLVWGFWFLVRWSGSHRLRDIALAGLLLGFIPTTRYPDAIVALGVGTFILWHWRRVPRFGLHLAVSVGAALIPIVPMLIRNHLVLGSFWKTGYALTNEQTGFTFGYFTSHAVGYLKLLQNNGLGMALALGLIGMVMLLASGRTRAVGMLLALAGIPFVMLYMAYYWAPGIANGGSAPMRFLVPVVPLFVVASAFALSQMSASVPRAARVAIPILIVSLHALLFGADMVNELRRINQNKVPLAMITESLIGQTEPGDVIISNNQLHQHLEFLQRWKLAESSIVSGRNAGSRGAARDPDDPAPMQQAKNDFRRSLYPDADLAPTKFRDDVMTWADGAGIYVVGSEADVRRIPGFQADDWVVIERIELPALPQTTDARPDAGGPRVAGGQPPARGGRGGGAFRPGEPVVIAKYEPAS
jgi:4-amino-4-deoxy-L-arabinose transferase-like glycosyltransferase